MPFPILPTPAIRAPLFQGTERNQNNRPAPPATPRIETQDAFVGRDSQRDTPLKRSLSSSNLASRRPSAIQTTLGAALSTALAPASPNGSSLTIPPSPEIREARRRSITEVATDAAVSLLPPMPFKRNVQQNIRISREVKHSTKLPEDPGDIDRKEYKIPKISRKDRKAVEKYYEQAIDGILNKTGGLDFNDEDIPTKVNPANAFTEADEPFTIKRIDARKRTGSDLSEFERDIEHEFLLREAGHLRTQQNQQEEELKAKQKKSS